MANAQILNLTPHPVRVGDREFPPAGQVPRLREVVSATWQLEGLPVADVITGVVEGLPEPRPGVFLIVSRPVAMALAGRRDDLLVPDDFVRDEQGRIVGARRLARLLGPEGEGR